MIDDHSKMLSDAFDAGGIKGMVFIFSTTHIYSLSNINLEDEMFIFQPAFNKYRPTTNIINWFHKTGPYCMNLDNFTWNILSRVTYLAMLFVLL